MNGLQLRSLAGVGIIAMAQISQLSGCQSPIAGASSTCKM